MLNDFISLLFPRLCAACGCSLHKNEQEICSHCLYTLPKTNFHTQQDNPVEQLFYGRARIHSAAAYYHFNKEGKTQQLVHQLKYKGQKNIGQIIGRIYGTELKSYSAYNTANIIIPVPLHHRKEKERGYNQSHFFAKGLSEAMGVECRFDLLQRKVFTASQTKKTRYERWENVENVFEVNTPSCLQNKHILLVDDVITTGATLEACAQVLLQINNVKLSIVAIAVAKY